MSPLLSVVIANYNYGRFLEEAIRSVLSQACQDFELIICDAASTDNSLDVIRKYEDKIAWWCSEKDGGQSAAFNKGFSHATGRFLTWLNADDVMLPGTIEKLKIAAERHPECEWFVGGVLWLDKDMRVIRCGRGRPFSERRFQEGVVSVWGPSSFFTHRMLDEVGGVDERFHYTMDSDLWFKFVRRLGLRYRPFCHYAWGLRIHEDAKMSGHNFMAGVKSCMTEEERMRAAGKWDLVEQEAQWMYGDFARKKSSLVSRILSASWLSVGLAKIDTLRFRGSYYREVFS